MIAITVISSSFMAVQPLGTLAAFFKFTNLYTVGVTPWTNYQPIARLLPTYRTTQTKNKRTQTSVPGVGLELTIPVLKRARQFMP
jgi:hypothetical protein